MWSYLVFLLIVIWVAIELYLKTIVFVQVANQVQTLSFGRNPFAAFLRWRQLLLLAPRGNQFCCLFMFAMSNWKQQPATMPRDTETDAVLILCYVWQAGKQACHSIEYSGELVHSFSPCTR